MNLLDPLPEYKHKLSSSAWMVFIVWSVGMLSLSSQAILAIDAARLV